MPKISNEKKSERRSQILQAAFQCFVEKGYKETTMREILAKAKLSAGAVYLYFNSKEEIIQALAESGKYHFKRISDEFGKEENPLINVLKTLAHLIDKEGGNFGIKLELSLLSVALNDNTIHKILNDKLNYDIAVVESLVRNSTLNISMEENILARVIIAVIQGLSIQKMLEPTVSMEKILEGITL